MQRTLYRQVRKTNKKKATNENIRQLETQEIYKTYAQVTPEQKEVGRPYENTKI